MLNKSLKSIPYLLLSVLLILFVVIYVSTAGVPGMWLDELSVRYDFSGRSWMQLLRFPMSLSYILCKVFDTAFFSDFAVRIPVLVGAGILAFCAYAAVAQFGSKAAGIACTCFVMFHPLFREYAQMNRFYIQGSGMMLLAWCLMQWALHNQKIGRWGCYAFFAFIAMHVWPWSVIWLGCISAYAGIMLLIITIRSKPPRIGRLLLQWLIIGMPLVLFALHYVLVPDLPDKRSGNMDGFWIAPVAFTLKYVATTTTEALRNVVDVPWIIWVFVASLFIALVRRRFDLLAFAAATLITWYVVVHICNNGHAVVMPKRIMFVYLNATVCMTAGGAILMHIFQKFFAKHALVYDITRFAAYVLVAALLTWYCWDRAILTYYGNQRDHGPAFKLCGQALRLRACPNASVLILEDGSGMYWGMLAYAKNKAQFGQLTFNALWTSNGQIITSNDVERLIQVGHQVWIVAPENGIEHNYRQVLTHKALRLPMGFDLWWIEPRFETMSVAQKTQETRKWVVDLAAYMKPLEISMHDFTNMVQRMPDAQFTETLPLLLKRDYGNLERCGAFALLCAQYILDDAAIAALTAPLKFSSRHTSMYEAIADNLVAISADFPPARKNKYVQKALECLQGAKRRSSDTAQRSYDVLSVACRVDAKRFVPPVAALISSINGLTLHVVFQPTTSTTAYALSVPTNATMQLYGASSLRSHLTTNGFASNGAWLSYTNTCAIPQTGSMSFIVMMRPPTNNVLQVPVGQGQGRSVSDSPWFIAFYPEQCITFMMEFVENNTNNYEIRTSFPWRKTWNSQWLVFIATYDAQRHSINLYKNDVLIGSSIVNADAVRNVLNNPLTIGSLQGSYPFHGDIREIALVNRAMSQKEITQLLMTHSECRSAE
ncbi:MAG: hypothetical protein NTV22_01660 [bacterium]|nr:hypothetical protein [bacterium]